MAKPHIPSPSKRRKRSPGYAIEPRRVVFSGGSPDAASRDTFGTHMSELQRENRRVKARNAVQRAKVGHQFWRNQANPDKLCSDILDLPMVKATWGSLVSEILQGGIAWAAPEDHKTEPDAIEAADFLNGHDELTSGDDKQLTMEGAARSLLQTVPRGFTLIERNFAEISDPVRGGRWAGKRRFKSMRWLSRELVVVDEDEFGFMKKFRDVKGNGRDRNAQDPDWWRYFASTWDEDSDAGQLFGNGLCIPTYEYYMAVKDALQAWRNVVERIGGGTVVATLSESESTEYEDVADKALEMLDNLLINHIAVLPKGMELSGRDLLAKTAGEVMQALKDTEEQAIQLIWVYQVATTGTDEGGANSRARTEALQEEKTARADQIATWFIQRFRSMWRPVIELNLGRRVPMPVPVLGLRARQILTGMTGEEGDGGDGGNVPAEPIAVGSLVAVANLTEKTAAGVIPPDSAKGLIRLAAPSMSDAQIAAIIDPTKDFTPRAAPTSPGVSSSPAAPSGRPTFQEPHHPYVGENVRERVRQAATRKLRAWFEEGREVDCSDPMPLRTEFAAAYEVLGIGRQRADQEARATCAFFSTRLGELLPRARTVGGKLVILQQVANELASDDRLAAIQERQAQED